MYTSVVPRWKALRQETMGLPAARVADRVLHASGKLQLPLDVHGIAAWLAVPIVRVPRAAWSGAVNSNGEAAAIWVRATDSKARQRFTIAHELGHLLLHEQGVAFRDDTFSGGPRETEANAFAAALLMPASMVKSSFEQFAVGFAAGATLGLLAAMFGVSRSAMDYRIDHVVRRQRTHA